MNQMYVRRRPSTKETAMAAAVAIGLGTVIGAATYYLTRAFLARDSVRRLPDRTDAGLEGEVEARE